ncbi:MAG: NAD+ synthase, partial [Planctomycetes bacterium]|nr:NAD+ synthase [Planctomycetota bacterium]
MPRYALAQINTTVGDLDGNAAKILSSMKEAAKHEPDLVIFPELTIAGYPPEDLLLKPGFFSACGNVMEELIPQVEGLALIGYPLVTSEGQRYNAAALVRDGVLEAVYHKCLLPNYAVLDEKRYFTP